MNLDLFSSTDSSLTHVLYLDTETTGVDPGVSEICEVGMLLVSYRGLARAELEDESEEGEDRRFSSLVRPSSGSIPPEASAVHHITTEMVASSPALGEICPRMQLLVSSADIIAAHNLPFDLSMLEGGLPGLMQDFGQDRQLDSLRLARHVWPDLPSYALQALRYRFGLDRGLDTSGGAHRALFDACLVMRLVEFVISSVLPEGCTSLSDICTLAASPIEVLTFEFGKYKGKLLDDVVARDPDYVRWLVTQPWAREEHPDLYHTLVRKTGRSEASGPARKAEPDEGRG